ncbi:hypothetical protein, partial [Kocuria rhizophila]|uniref:hypothetical protein n=1 Tax=Kocuria rhizophila TaxID=72000 RepID=UPI001C92C777
REGGMRRVRAGRRRREVRKLGWKVMSCKRGRRVKKVGVGRGYGGMREWGGGLVMGGGRGFGGFVGEGVGWGGGREVG